MRKILRTVFMLIFASLSLMINAQNNENVAQEKNSTENAVKKFDWGPLMKAIIYVESGGNPRAIGGNSVGILQITPVCVKQCNILLQRKGSKKRYTLNDRYSIEKSKEMFIMIQEEYNPEHNIEKAIRMWNGGPGYKIKSTNGYYKKVMARYKQ
jgi:hypothetical protein